MTETERIEEIARIRARLADAARTAEPAEWRQIVRKTIRQLDDVTARLEKDRAERKKKRKLSTKIQRTTKPRSGGSKERHNSQFEVTAFRA